MKEQSSTSNLPKHKSALEEKYKRQDEDLPKPTGWRLLVLPYRMKDKTKGGLVLADSTLERQQVASQCGLVFLQSRHRFQDICFAGVHQVLVAYERSDEANQNTPTTGAPCQKACVPTRRGDGDQRHVR